MGNVRAAHICLFVANLIYGINYVVAKDLMPTYLEPFGFIFFRVSGAFIMFFLMYRFMAYQKVDRADWGRLALCAAFGIAANQMMFFYGLNLTNPVNASIMMTSNPILVLIATAIILKTRLTKFKILGVAVGITGAIMLILQGGELDVNATNFEGDIFIFLNALSYGIYLVLVKPLMSKYEPITVATWVFGIGFIYVLPFGFEQAMEVKWGIMEASHYLRFIYVIIFTTFLAYLLNIFALKQVSPNVVSTYLYLQPVFAAVITVMMGKGDLNWTQGLATLLIFTGVYFVSKPSKTTTITT